MMGYEWTNCPLDNRQRGEEAHYNENGTVDNLSTIPASFFLLLEIVIGL